MRVIPKTITKTTILFTCILVISVKSQTILKCKNESPLQSFEIDSFCLPLSEIKRLGITRTRRVRPDLFNQKEKNKNIGLFDPVTVISLMIIISLASFIAK